MRKFEAKINASWELDIWCPETNELFPLNSETGYLFADEIISEFREKYPSVIQAIEQKIKMSNRSLYATMLQNTKIYKERVAYTICACCFGEDDEKLDYDGKYFHMEYPRQCREAKYCPWNGYAERNKDSFFVRCGARREYGLTPQERRVLDLIKSGVSEQAIIADSLCITKATVWKHMGNIYTKTGTTGIAELLTLINNEII